MARDYDAACSACAAHEADAAVLREALRQVRPEALESLQLRAGTMPSVASLREGRSLRANRRVESDLRAAYWGDAADGGRNVERLQPAATPAVADYASKASPRAAMTG